MDIRRQRGNTYSAQRYYKPKDFMARMFHRIVFSYRLSYSWVVGSGSHCLYLILVRKLRPNNQIPRPYWMIWARQGPWILLSTWWNTNGRLHRRSLRRPSLNARKPLKDHHNRRHPCRCNSSSNSNSFFGKWHSSWWCRPPEVIPRV